MTNKQTNSWVEDFDKAWFQWEIVEQNCSWGSVDSDALVSFFKDYLSKTLSQEKEKWMSQMQEAINKDIDFAAKHNQMYSAEAHKTLNLLQNK